MRLRPCTKIPNRRPAESPAPSKGHRETDRDILRSPLEGAEQQRRQGRVRPGKGGQEGGEAPARGARPLQVQRGRLGRGRGQARLDQGPAMDRREARGRGQEGTLRGLRDRPDQRGANENMNGLIRQYLPKGTSFEDLTREKVKRIEWKLNNRPRKRLGFLTPLEYNSRRVRRIYLTT